MKFPKIIIYIWTVLLAAIIGVAAVNLWPNVMLPISVEEPIEILDYSPTSLALLPGESENISITIQNHATLNYSVILHFQLNNTAYQSLFVTCSDTVYNVTSGVHVLHGYITVAPDAYAINTTLRIDVQRIEEGGLPHPPSEADLLEEYFNTLAPWYIDPESTLVEINPAGEMHTIGGFAVYYLSFPAKFTIEFRLKVDAFGGENDYAIFQIYTSRSHREFSIHSDKIRMGNHYVGYEEFSVTADNDWHIWRLLVDEDVQEVDVYRDGAFLTTFTIAQLRNDLVQRIYTGSKRNGLTETHWDYLFISTGLLP